MSVVDSVRADIAALEATREQLYSNLQLTTRTLEQKKTLLAAFLVVSTDAAAYDLWQQAAKETPRPVVE